MYPRIRPKENYERLYSNSFSSILICRSLKRRVFRKKRNFGCSQWRVNVTSSATTSILKINDEERYDSLVAEHIKAEISSGANGAKTSAMG